MPVQQQHLLAAHPYVDGLWGVEWSNPKGSWITGALIEYVDFRDQSGPIHWAPSDRPGSTISTEATGCDRYFNNSSFNANANYGKIGEDIQLKLSSAENKEQNEQWAGPCICSFHDLLGKVADVAENSSDHHAHQKT